jgi:hypothetical protein
MKPMPFQQWTIDVAVRVLKRKHKERRFLIADEVGLGKTVVAAGVIDRLSQTITKPLRVFYVAPGHTIAHQNQDRLLPKGARAPKEDRLGLFPYTGAVKRQVEVYALSPETSFQTRGTGKKAERLRIELLLEMAYPDLDLPEDLFTIGTTNWRYYKAYETRNQLPTHKVVRVFKFFLCKELDVKPSGVGQELKQLAKKRYAFFTRLRKVLALTLLQLHRPDLLILDEFQRYRELLNSDEKTLFSNVLSPMVVTQSPAVMLLSATPFRLLDASQKKGQSGSEYENLYKLLSFLAGGDQRIATEAARLFAEFSGALHAYLEADTSAQFQSDANVKAAKSNLENFLKRYISRTERLQFEDIESVDELDMQRPIRLVAEDVAMYKHLAVGFRRTREQGGGRERCCYPGDAVSFWLSVPLPAQSLGKGYKAWSKSRDNLLNAPGPPCQINRSGTTSGSEALGSAKLRKLQGLCPPGQLSLPWCAPSLPWWHLGGPWRDLKEDAGQKLLLFSRFRATPGAVASLMSLSAENSRSRRGARLRASGVVYSMFYPSPLLIDHINPQPYLGQGFDAVRLGAQRSMRALLSRLKVPVVDRTQKERRQRRNIWTLLLSLEAQYDSKFGLDRRRRMQGAWSEITGDGLPRLIHVDSISRRELRTLAELAVEAPGVVCGRAFHRYQHLGDTTEQCVGVLREQALVELTWKALRTYLDDPVFLKKTAKRGAIEQMRDLVRDGCLEAVLDEHIWHSAKKPKATLNKIAEELRDALQLSPGASGFHIARRRGSGAKVKDGIRVVCRAAVAFGSTERFEDGKAVRPDEVLKAFNSPFRPFLLASTSVGQEGLDFHVWCDRIVHWDLCRTPLDLEQREGRIQRFLGLGVRRALARTHGSKIAGLHTELPWNSLEEEAERTSEWTANGIVPWWVIPEMKLQKHFFLIEQSRDIAKYRLLLKQRMLYRFALGQPNPHEFVKELTLKAMQNEVGDRELRELMLNLSPATPPGRSS